MNYYTSSPKNNFYIPKNNGVSFQTNKEVKNCFLKKGFLYKPNSTLNVLTNTQYYDNISNMNRQLSNISFNDKQILNISKTKIISDNDSIRESLKFKNIINQNNYLKIINNESINFIAPRKIYNESNYIQNEELRNDNIKLKENVKFLLNQIKKYQKMGFSIETDNESNLVQELREEIVLLRQYITEYENKLKKIEDSYANIVRENLYFRNNINKSKFFEYLEEENVINFNLLSNKIDEKLNNNTIHKNYKKHHSLSQGEEVFKLSKNIKKKPLIRGLSSTFIKKSLFNNNNITNNVILSNSNEIDLNYSNTNLININKKNNISQRYLYSNNNLNNIPNISSEPEIIFKISNNNNNLSKGPKYKNLIFYYDISTNKYNSKNYLEGSSLFNLAFNITENHSNDIGLSISNGYLIITGKKTDQFFFYNSKDNLMYNLCNLNHNHCKGSLIKINNNTLLCLSGMTSIFVEMYNIKENKWNDISKMNRPHSESSYVIINNILYSFFGFDYELNRYIDFIEYFNLNKLKDKNEKWKKIKVSNEINIKGHGIFILNNNNHNSDNHKLIIVGGSNSLIVNTGYIEIDINGKNTESIQVKWENYNFYKNSLKKGLNNEDEKKIIFSSSFYSYFDKNLNQFYSFNFDNELNCHIISHNDLKHEIKKNTLKL